jgi:hypothetical protein
VDNDTKAYLTDERTGRMDDAGVERMVAGMRKCKTPTMNYIVECVTNRHSLVRHLAMGYCSDIC